jgi:cytochrome c oxidase subunit 2
VKRLIVLIGLGSVLGAATGAAIIAADAMPRVASAQADTTDNLYFVMLVVMGAIFGIVVIMLAYSIWRFRAPHGDEADGPPIHGITWLEVTWTALPATIVLALTAISWIGLNSNDVATARGHVDVIVIGQKWDWNYALPANGIDEAHAIHELLLPVDTPVSIAIKSKDVIHGFWVPDFRISMNATPGQTNRISVTPNRIGSYAVVCTFICGDGHAQMDSEVKGHYPVRIRVVSRGDWDRWLAGQQATVKKALANPDAPAVAVFNTSGCGSCHTWKPAGSKGAVGPSLDNLAADAKAAKEDVTTYVKESIVAPNAHIAPGFKAGLMPATFGQSISPTDLDVLVKALARGA